MAHRPSEFDGHRRAEEQEDISSRVDVKQARASEQQQYELLISARESRPIMVTRPARTTQGQAAVKRWPRVASVSLPLLFMFLLPSLKPAAIRDAAEWQREWAQPVSRLPEKLYTALDRAGGADLPLVDLLLSLIRLPLDRWRLDHAGLLAQAREISAKHDLQGEEQQASPQSMMAPAEPRLAYASGQAATSGAYQSGPSVAYQRQLAPDPSQADQASAGYEYAAAPGQAELEPALAMAPVDGQALAGPAESASSAASLAGRSDLAAVRALNVKCEKNHMTVNIVFDRPFYGLVFSKGHYNDQKCVHLAANSGQTTVNFDIHLGKCGMTSSDASGNAYAGSGSPSAGQQQLQQQPNGLYIENTIIIQYDPQVQEIFDQARKLRCTWYDYYEKSVTFRPYNVDMLDAVTANFLGDNIQCWMQIQVGKGPWSSEVAGIVKIGQTMTMVLAIKDDENRFDMLVRNCVAHDGKHQPIQLVDEYGCVARPKIMSRFQKVRNFGPAATVVSYAHFQAFKFPDSMSVHFQCVIQVCRYECPEPVCSHQASAPAAAGSGLADQASSSPADYAASGTELISSKEAAPPGGAGHAQGAFKIDDSQGRVQVKLDTSMLAGLHSARGSTGPLPPHLLHTASSQLESVRVPTSHALLGGAAAHRASQSQRSANRSGSLVAPLGGRQSPYALTHRAPTLYAPAGAHRMGELSSAGAPSSAQANQGAEADQAERALSTIAAPRSMRMAAPTVLLNGTGSMSAARKAAPNHRYARSIGADRDSTAVQTHKTIQVVSPDDMAFSLTSDDIWTAQEAGKRKNAQLLLEPSSVCFSLGKLMVALMVALAGAAASVIAISLMVLKQRAKDGKLAAIYDIDSQQQVVSRAPEGAPRPGARPNGLRANHQDSELEEMHRRNKCLARIYSQFVPGAHWQP